MSAAATDTTSLTELIDAADRAAAAGRITEAQALLARAQKRSASHPRVLSALGLLALRAGDATGARQHFEAAARTEPRSALLWLHVALGARAQGDLPAELAALERSLALDPRFHPALLQKATLLERQGNTRAAARVFEAFLKCVPPRAEQPAPLREAVERAEKSVAADHVALEQRIRKRLAADAPGTAFGDRAEHCLDILLGRRRVFTPQPTFMYFPRLPAIEFFDRKDFPWLDTFEAATSEIRAELEQVLADRNIAEELVPYVDYEDAQPLDQWRGLNRSRQWSAYYFIKNGIRINDHLARCPKTAALLAGAPLADIPGEAPTAFFSLLAPRTRIPPHTGVSNTRLVVHVPLIVPPGCGFRVGSETRHWESGRAWVFDDTIEHEAWNDSDEPRAILLIDTWNPHLTAAERAWVRAATAAASEYRAG
jgi:aspartyl/asparaginyl beta-hydroxylase (cupin superfamily)